MRKLYNEGQVVKIPQDLLSGWDGIISSPRFVDKAREHNDGGTGLVYVQCEDKEGKKAPIVGPHMYYSDMKTALRGSQRKELDNIFVVFESVIDDKAAIIGFPQERNILLMSNLGTKRLYLGETKPNIEETGSAISKKCIVIEVKYNGKKTEFYFPAEEESWKIVKDLEKFEHIAFSGMRVERRYKEGKDIVEDYIYFITEYKGFNDSYNDLANIIPNIKKISELSPFINTATKKIMYSEELSKLILFNTFYVKIGDPVFNVILYGHGGSGKSSAVQIHGLIFSNDGEFIDMTQSTVKGLIISYGEGAKAGLLISPVNFVKVIDELFRRSTSDAKAKGKVDPTSEISATLEKLMGVVLRNQRGISASGNGQVDKGMGYMRDSFLACDNMVGEVRNAFCTFIIDGGIIRRFSFLRVDEEDKIRVQEADSRPSMDDLYEAVSEKYEAMGLTVQQVKRFSRWFRKVAITVQVSGKKSKSEADEVQKDALKNIWNELYAGQKDLEDTKLFEDFFIKWSMTQNLVPTYEALVRCCAVARSVEECQEEKIPNIIILDVDYIEAKKLFRRILNDSINIYREGIVKWMKGRSMETTYSTS